MYGVPGVIASIQAVIVIYSNLTSVQVHIATIIDDNVSKGAHHVLYRLLHKDTWVQSLIMPIALAN